MPQFKNCAPLYLNLFPYKHDMQDRDSNYSASSPRYNCLSLDAEQTTGSSGWNTTSFTEPLWPGNLYAIWRELTSQMYTNLSELPQVTCNEHSLHHKRSTAKASQVLTISIQTIEGRLICRLSARKFFDQNHHQKDMCCKIISSVLVNANSDQGMPHQGCLQNFPHCLSNWDTPSWSRPRGTSPKNWPACRQETSHISEDSSQNCAHVLWRSWCIYWLEHTASYPRFAAYCPARTENSVGGTVSKPKLVWLAYINERPKGFDFWHWRSLCYAMMSFDLTLWQDCDHRKVQQLSLTLVSKADKGWDIQSFSEAKANAF